MFFHHPYCKRTKKLKPEQGITFDSYVLTQNPAMEEELMIDEIKAEEFISESNEAINAPETRNNDEMVYEENNCSINDWNSLVWLCYHCGKGFNAYANLKHHKESCHRELSEEEEHFICFDCEEPLLGYSLFLNHIRNRHYDSLKLCCDVCNDVLPDYAHLANHRDEHIEFSNEIHPDVHHCNLCEEVAATERILKLHTQKYHDLKSSDETKEKDLSDLFEAEKVKYECPDMEDESVVEDCVDYEEENNDAEELYLYQWQCVENLKIKASIKDIHMYNIYSMVNSKQAPHMKERPFECAICSVTFTREAYLKQHMATYNSERPFKCDVCSKAFATKAHLKIHMRNHNSERPFECDVCSKTFTRKEHLKNHMTTHTSERPLKCEICPQTFKTKNNLMQHIKAHNNERPFECDVCSNEFTTKGNLKKHMITHNSERPFKCEICPQTFKTKNNLMRHIKTHNNERPFECDVCSNEFTTKGNLKIHMAIHDREKLRIKGENFNTQFVNI